MLHIKRVGTVTDGWKPPGCTPASLAWSSFIDSAMFSLLFFFPKKGGRETDPGSQDAIDPPSSVKFPSGSWKLGGTGQH